MRIEDEGGRLVHREADGVAFLRYRIEAGRLVMEHTEVPPQMGGRGIGSALVEAAVERARADGLGVVAECEFAAAWLRRHADQVADVTVDVDPDRS